MICFKSVAEINDDYFHDNFILVYKSIKDQKLQNTISFKFVRYITENQMLVKASL